MDAEAERRIEEARQTRVREQEAAEFLRSLGPNDDLVKPVYNPEAYVMRSKAQGAASRGEIRPTGCSHALWQVEQYVDDDPLMKRQGRPLNLFECRACHMLLWLVDPFGQTVGDV